jgi:outer membrane protein assembly factor BamB
MQQAADSTASPVEILYSGEVAPGGGIAAQDDLVYVGTLHGQLYAVDSAAAAVRASRNVHVRIGSRLLATENGVFFAGYHDQNTVVVRCDLNTLDTIWQKDTSFTDKGRCGIVVCNDTIVLAGSEGTVAAWNVDGEHLWTRRYNALITTGLTSDEHRGTVVFGDDRGYLYSLHVVDGRPAWTFLVTNCALTGGPCLLKDPDDPCLYVIGDGLLEVHATNGAVNRRVSAPENVHWRGDPVAAWHTIVLTGDDGSLYSWDVRDTQNAVFRAYSWLNEDMPISPLAIGCGLIAVSSHKGTLYVLEPT